MDHLKKIRQPFELMRVLIVAEYAQALCSRHNRSFSIEELRSSIGLKKHLDKYRIPPIDDATSAFNNSVKYYLNCAISPITALSYLTAAYPYLIKDYHLLQRHEGDTATFCALLYHLIRDFISCPAEYIDDSEYCCKQFYYPKAGFLSSLGIRNVGDFINCWGSLAYYNVRSEDIYTPANLNSLKKLYCDQKIPYQVLLSRYVECKYSKLRNLPLPQESWQSTKHPYIESGISPANDLMAQTLQILGLNPLQVINSLFYPNRNDSLVEKTILYPASLSAFVSGNNKTLIINPSPDFLEEYAENVLTRNRETHFAVTDETVATAYSLQFEGNFNKDHPYRFTPFDKLNTIIDRFRYVIIMARDSDLASFSDALSLCDEKARVVCFLPQTMLTSKNDKTFTEICHANHIYINTILSLPSELSHSGRRKKLILHAQKAAEQPEFFSLFNSKYWLANEIDHYTMVDQIPYLIPYKMLFKRYTIAQMIGASTDSLRKHNASALVKKQYKTAQIYSFSKEIPIHHNVYKKGDLLAARACFRHLLNDESSRLLGKRLTENYELSGCKNSQEVYTRIDKWVLSPAISPIIANEITRYYEVHSKSLSLKTVWYCIRDELKSEITYDDALACSLFCGNTKTLSNLILGETTQEHILKALNDTLSSEASDQKYHRLLSLIFRVAVKRGFLSSNPFLNQKTSIEYDTRNAMNELRDALSKAFLSFSEMRRMLDYLLEPVDEHLTPRVVKDGLLLAALIRLCTGMPLRQICALKWKHFKPIAHTNEYQFFVVQQLNDNDEPVTVSNYRYIAQYRKVPCVSILKDILLQRKEYIQKNGTVSSSQDIMTLPIIYQEEHRPLRSSRRKYDYCTIRQARNACTDALQKANVSSNVITLLEGESAFHEDLNSRRNDIYYSNFCHHANCLCQLEEGQLCYIVGRKAPDCLSGHYVDYGNDFIQLIILNRLNRLWAVVRSINYTAAHHKYASCTLGKEASIIAPSSPTGFAAIDLTITPSEPLEQDSLHIQVEGNHRVIGTITVFAKEDSK